jgi:NOL1/NOP2/fmu family ribosome biogenesis protein
MLNPIMLYLKVKDFHTAPPGNSYRLLEKLNYIKLSIYNKNMKIKIMDNAKKKKFIQKVSYLGIKKIPYLLLNTGNERIAAYSGSLSVDELYRYSELLWMEGVGLYFAKDFGDETRLSLDALHLLKEQITENIIDVNESQVVQWFEGKTIELTEKQQEEATKKNTEGFVAVRFEEDFIGTGKISQDKKFVSSFLPKERRVKSY